MSLRLLVLILGLSIPMLNPMAKVEFAAGGPEGILAVACHSDFREIPGNAQHLCPAINWPTILIYTDATDWTPELLANVVAHEDWHLSHTDGFREAEAYAYGCEVQRVAWCNDWTH